MSISVSDCSALVLRDVYSCAFSYPLTYGELMPVYSSSAASEAKDRAFSFTYHRSYLTNKV